MATSIDFKALYAEARRAAAAAKQQQGAVGQVQEPSNEITNRSWNDHDTGHVVEEIEDECVHLTPSGELAVDAFAPFRVGDVPAVYYLPNFISDAEEQRLLSAIYSEPEARWTSLKRRRLQMWGGKPSAAGMAQEELPSWLGELSQLLKEKKVFKKDFNHVLINEYEPGQGIMAHEDGPLYISHVAILSLQSALMMEIYEKPFADKKKLFSLYLEPRSLLVFREDVYKRHLHSIEERMTDNLDDDVANLHLLNTSRRGEVEREHTRVSLTIRVVKKLRRSTPST